MLAKAGWWGASPSGIFKAPVDEVINAFHYENFYNQYQETYIEINKETRK